MSIATVGNFGQDSINDRTLIQKELQARRARPTGGTGGAGAREPRPRYVPRHGGDFPETAPSRRGHDFGEPSAPEVWTLEQDDAASRPATSRSATSAPPRTPLLRHGGAASAPQLLGGQGSEGPAGGSGGPVPRRSLGSSHSAHGNTQRAPQQSMERSALEDYYEYMREKKHRDLMKNFERPAHLQVGPNPIDMGCPRITDSEAQRSLTRAIKMAVDPKWSTELKKINDRVGLRLEYQQRLSAAGSGAVIPELNLMQPKRHLSNPPTPYFKPGHRGLPPPNSVTRSMKL